MKRYLLIVVLTILSSIAIGQNKVKKLSASDFFIKMEQCEDKLILDCSELKTYKKEHLEDAVSIASSKDMIRVLMNIDKETHLFIYCKHGDRSKTASKKIKALGFKNIYELKDGLHDWKELEYPTIKK